MERTGKTVNNFPVALPPLNKQLGFCWLKVRIKL